MILQNMNPEQLNTLMTDVTSQLERTGCDYLLMLLSGDDEASLGSFTLNMSDLDAAAAFVSQAITQGGEMGKKLQVLLGKVNAMTSELDDLQSAEQTDNILHRKGFRL